MTVTLNLTQEAVYTAVRAFLLTAITSPAVEIVQGQVNRVAEPREADFIVMWATRRARLATNVQEWSGDDPTDINDTQHTQFDVQIDVHGPRGADLAQTISTLWRSPYACAYLEASGIQPLYNTDPSQLPFINGEKQYEDRWVIVLSMQANPTVSTPQEFADTLAIEVFEVDATYPTGA